MASSGGSASCFGFGVITGGRVGGSGAKERLGSFDAAAMARGHERRVPVWGVIRLLEDEVDVRALLDLLVYELDVVLSFVRRASVQR